jgi:hypothetical protein
MALWFIVSNDISNLPPILPSFNPKNPNSDILILCRQFQLTIISTSSNFQILKFSITTSAHHPLLPILQSFNPANPNSDILILYR